MIESEVKHTSLLSCSTSPEEHNIIQRVNTAACGKNWSHATDENNSKKKSLTKGLILARLSETISTISFPNNILKYDITNGLARQLLLTNLNSGE